MAESPGPRLNHSRVTATGREPERWMLFLHGIYGSGRNWGSIARRVVDARPEWGVILVDLRMHGRSLGFSPPHTLEASAGDLDALVESLDLHAAAVLGHSFGGKVALLYAMRHGDELEQVWIMDSTPAVREPSGSAWRMIETVRALPAEFSSRADAVEGLRAAGYATGVAEWMAMNLEISDGLYRWRLDLDAVEEMLRDFFRADLWETVENPPAAVEIHFVKATGSDTLEESAVARVDAAAGGGRVFLHRVEGGHWINTDNPDEVVRLLVERLGH